MIRTMSRPTTKRWPRSVVGRAQAAQSPIEIVDYDSGWPALYERGRRCASARRSARRSFGSSTRARLPCLPPAKPIIDIVLEVQDSADEPAYVPDLEAAGYVLRIREPEWFEHRLFKGRTRR